MGYGRIFRRRTKDDEIERIYAYFVGNTVKWCTNDKRENERMEGLQVRLYQHAS